MLRIFANSLITRMLYTHIFVFIFAMWDFVSCFKCASDVTARGAFDARIEYESSIFTYDGGCVAQSYLSMNYFKNDLISTVELRSYNG